MAIQRPGIWNDKAIQQRAVKTVVKSLGPDVWRAMDNDRSVNLLPHLLHAKNKVLPEANVNTVRSWFKSFCKYGDVPAVIRRERRKKRGYRSRMTEEEQRVLEEIVKDYPYLYLDEISEQLYERTGCNKRYHDSTIWRTLKKKCKYSLQVVTERAKQQDQDELDEYHMALHEKVYDPSMVVFIDETARDRNAARRRRHWSKRRKTPLSRTFFMGENTRTRYTLLSACDVNGFIVEACELVERERSAKDADPTRGTIDKERFVLWLKTYLLPILGNFELNEPRSVVVLDNATIHHSDEIIELIESTGATWIYTAPYYPEWNPIEYMFGKYKAMLERYHLDDWHHSHMKALLSISPADAGSWFRHCGVPGCEHFPRARAASRGGEPSPHLCTVAAAVAATTVVLATTVAVLGKRKR